ncbi:CoA transferase [Caballeronia sp. J97]|uniref:CaiB/BaiF CoA transferase family protein n=1 Tax=Caballeronia sp. J97 TaxID=2805429 RepID=UPI002AB1DE61|nr:CoA transferase [Caballeronia sp. J97]
MQDQTNTFSGLKVVDFASYIAGPAATTILSDFGAAVIKVEPPGTGDPYRQFYRSASNPVSEENYPWQLTNRNKKSLALNLKSAEAAGVVERLVRWADVVVVNFPPNVREKLGLSYEKLSELNSRLIYADLTGYGTRGPEADRPGFDGTAYWARSGLMHVTRDGNSPPTLPIPGIGDHATASTLYSAIVTGLYRREKTGKGSHVTTSLIAQGAWASAVWIEGGLNGARIHGSQSRGAPQNALFNSYQTSDGRWLLLVLLQDKDWTNLVSAMQLSPLLEGHRFQDATGRAIYSTALVELLDHAFSQQPLEYWKTTFDAARVIYGVVQVIEEVVRDEQMYANDIIVPLAEPTEYATHTVSSPIQIVGVDKVVPRRAPQLGEHSATIMEQLGYSEHEISRFLRDSVVQQHS